jgi:hypothetical protein
MDSNHLPAPIQTVYDTPDDDLPSRLSFIILTVYSVLGVFVIEKRLYSVSDRCVVLHMAHCKQAIGFYLSTESRYYKY